MANVDTDAAATMAGLNHSLSLLKNLRVSLYSLFDSLHKGPEDESETTEFLRSVQQRLITMDSAFSELEKSGSNLPVNNPPNINSSALSLEPENDNFKVFEQLVHSYTWSKKMEEYSAIVHGLLKENQLKRIGPSTGYLAKRPRKTPPHATPPIEVDRAIQSIQNSLQQKLGDTLFRIDILRPMTASTVLVVSMGRVFKALIFLRGMLAERTIVKSFSESESLENGQVDMYGESRYEVFRLVTQSAQAAVLQFQSSLTAYPETGLYTFFGWLHSYHNLFSVECQYCGNIIKEGLPPTARTFTKAPVRYHVQCSTAAVK